MEHDENKILDRSSSVKLVEKVGAEGVKNGRCKVWEAAEEEVPMYQTHKRPFKVQLRSAKLYYYGRLSSALKIICAHEEAQL